MQMEKWQRNVIFKAVVDGGLDPRECTFDYDDAGARITHVPSASYLLLAGDITQYTATAVVGESKKWPSGLPTFWPEVELRVRGWAREVKEDVDTPDLWAELQREREILTGARYDGVENTPFTPEEQAKIAEQLREIRAYVKRTYSLSEAHMRSVEEKFDYLQAAARHSNRREWRFLFLGVMFEVIVDGLVPAEAVRDILTMAFHGLQQVLEGVSRPPQLPPTP